MKSGLTCNGGVSSQKDGMEYAYVLPFQGNQTVHLETDASGSWGCIAEWIHIGYNGNGMI